MKTLSVLALLLMACSTDMEPMTETQWDSGKSRPFPGNSVWTIHTLERTGCDNVPIPMRMQFTYPTWVDVMMSDGNDTEVTWDVIDTQLVLTGGIRVQSNLTMEAAVWHTDRDSTYMTTTVHYSGLTECTAELVAIRE